MKKLFFGVCLAFLMVGAGNASNDMLGMSFSIGSTRDPVYEEVKALCDKEVEKGNTKKYIIVGMDHGFFGPTFCVLFKRQENADKFYQKLDNIRGIMYLDHETSCDFRLLLDN